MVLPAWYFAAVGFAFGAILASFGAVLIERLPVRASLWTPSHCACGRKLAPWENVPLLGYLQCAGKARCCRMRIPRWYVVLELCGGTLVAFAAVVFQWTGLVVAGLLSVCVYLTVGLLRRRQSGAPPAKP